MRILVDMNMSPKWCDYLRQFGIEALHWSVIGAATATDREIMVWAREHDCIVLTHDLDFGTILAATSANAPSVVQIRVQDVLPSAMGLLLVNTLREHELALRNGALLIVDANRYRVRVLPLRN